MIQILSWLSFWYFSFIFYVKKKERKEEKYIKYKEKYTFTPIFNAEKGERGYRCLMESTSGGLSGTF